MDADSAVSLGESSETNWPLPLDPPSRPERKPLNCGCAATDNCAVADVATRQTERRTIDLQLAPRGLGYLKGQNFDGTVGKPTILLPAKPSEGRS
jgi:hypothetical protein